MSAASYQREAVRRAARERDLAKRLAAVEARERALGERLASVTAERDRLWREQYGEQRDAARVREAMANPAELEAHRLAAWEDQLDPGESAPAAGWPLAVEEPELYVAGRLGLARTTYAPRAAPPTPARQEKVDAEPGAIERHLGPRAELHRTLVNGASK